MISKELLDILCCPKCHGDLLYQPQQNLLICKACGRRYAIQNDIPIMLVEDTPKAS